MPAFPRRFAVFLLLALGAGGAQAQTWPARPLRFVVPFPPGGTADLLGRIAARELQAALGQPVVVENRPGAGGAVGSDAVAKSPPDGYMLVLSNIASHAIGPAVNRSAPYDPLRGFTHIGLIAAVPSGIAVSAASPHATLAALLERARSAPGAVRFGWQIDGLIAAVPDIGRNERLRMLAITSETRAARWKDVPSVRELNLPALVASNWFGVSGPAGIPAPVAERVNQALVAGLNSPELAERLRDLGAEPNRMTRADYTAMIAADIARWAEVVHEANIKAD
jgi:tripartite-type tricarboxylate transporter receptor subunit TctC